MITPQTTHVIAGEGMPCKTAEGSGDLCIKFNIMFPQQFNPQIKDQIV